MRPTNLKGKAKSKSNAWCEEGEGVLSQAVRNGDTKIEEQVTLDEDLTDDLAIYERNLAKMDDGTEIGRPIICHFD